MCECQHFHISTAIIFSTLNCSDTHVGEFIPGLDLHNHAPSNWTFRMFKWRGRTLFRTCWLLGQKHLVYEAQWVDLPSWKAIPWGCTVQWGGRYLSGFDSGVTEAQLHTQPNICPRAKCETIISLLAGHRYKKQEQNRNEDDTGGWVGWLWLLGRTSLILLVLLLTDSGVKAQRSKTWPAALMESDSNSSLLLSYFLPSFPHQFHLVVLWLILIPSPVWLSHWSDVSAVTDAHFLQSYRGFKCYKLYFNAP